MDSTVRLIKHPFAGGGESWKLPMTVVLLVTVGIVIGLSLLFTLLFLLLSDHDDKDRHRPE
jgi:hypothetical protein